MEFQPDKLTELFMMKEVSINFMLIGNNNTLFISNQKMTTSKVSILELKFIQNVWVGSLSKQLKNKASEFLKTPLNQSLCINLYLQEAMIHYC